VVVHTYNSSTWEAEVSLGYIMRSVKKKKKKNQTKPNQINKGHKEIELTEEEDQVGVCLGFWVCMICHLLRHKIQEL
jgi:hypothetical protein